jgi:hypothetical protein
MMPTITSASYLIVWRQRTCGLLLFWRQRTCGLLLFFLQDHRSVLRKIDLRVAAVFQLLIQSAPFFTEHQLPLPLRLLLLLLLPLHSLHSIDPPLWFVLVLVLLQPKNTIQAWS